ncbi:PTPA-CTERM sorting domain-containing protein [Nodosilinea nodulosa]|uniref:PTPA-CTERM sorting domain-containing protein n=1 Tax=Nodosilinea nodulosa TaxID=416001 RepID=UPI000318A9CC|nr:PTPA-CTERM sorting domain-containing protein [Nodosilinea nodulosa]
MRISALVRLSIVAAGAGMLSLGIVQPSQAATIFSDNFDFENGGDGVLNFAGFSNWNVTDGTVDLIPVNGNFDFYPGNGLYVDLDGSTLNAGVLTTKQAFGPGNYTFSFKLGGSTVLGNSNQVTVSFGNFSEVFSLASADPLTTFTRSVSLTSLASLSFSNGGGDNIGAILDDVNVSTVPVPTPALLPGLFGIGIAALRRKQDETGEETA